MNDKCDILYETLKAYHEAHIIKYDKMLEDIQKYLDKYDPNYFIDGLEDVIDIEDILDIEDLVHEVVSIFDILELYHTDDHLNVCTDKIRDVILWYLETYHKSCKLQVKGKLNLSSIYGEMMNP